LRDSGLSSNALELSLDKINTLLLPYRGKIAFYDKICMAYAMLGIALIASLAIICGI
jgi:hypothetical protein